MAGTVAEVAFFVALIAVILIHEAAHFAMAKRFGIKVDEFFVGFGPRIWSFRRGETEYGLKAFPAGGYVRIAGMNPYQYVPPEDLPRTFGAKPIWQRSVVIAAGPATHFVLAFLCFALWLGLVGRPVAHDPIVAEVSATLNGHVSPAAQVGLRPGDRIVGINGIAHPTDVEIIHITRGGVGRPITFQIQRDERTLEVIMSPVRASVEGKMVGRVGVLLSEARETSGPVGAVTGASRLIGGALVGVVKSIGHLFGPEGLGRIWRLLFTNAPRQPTDIVTVVGASRVAAETAASGRFWDILLIFASLNVFIGLLNLLPLPPFDGGHLAVLAVEKVRGRKVDMRKLVPVSAAAAAVFVLLFLAVLYLDIVKPVNLTP